MSSFRFQIIRYLPNSEFYLHQGISHAQSGRFTQAILSFQKAIILKPDWIEPYGHLAWTYLNSGRYQKAEKIYLQLLESKPMDAELYYIVSHLYQLQNQPEKSKEYLSKAVQLDSRIQDKIHFQIKQTIPVQPALKDKIENSLQMTIFALFWHPIILRFLEVLLILYRSICFYLNYLFVYIYDFLRDYLTGFYTPSWQHNKNSIQFPLRKLLWFFHRYRTPFYYGGIYYPRNIETPLALSWLCAEPGHKVLEIGTGLSVLTCTLVKKGCQLYCTDADSYILQLKDFLQQTNLKKYLNEGKLKIEIADGRQLSYSDNSFDRVISISTIEHFPEDGDVKMACEVARILRPGGLAVITTEMEAEYREHWAEMPFYTGFQYQSCIPENLQSNEKNTKIVKRKIMGFYRFYTKKEIMERIVNPSGLHLLNFGLIGDILPLRKHLEPDTPYWKRFGLTHFSSLIACLSFRKLREDQLTINSSGVVGYVVLQKQ